MTLCGRLPHYFRFGPRRGIRYLAPQKSLRTPRTTKMLNRTEPPSRRLGRTPSRDQLRIVAGVQLLCLARSLAVARGSRRSPCSDGSNATECGIPSSRQTSSMLYRARFQGPGTGNRWCSRMIFLTVSASSLHRIAICDCERDGRFDAVRAAARRFAMTCFMTRKWVRLVERENLDRKKFGSERSSQRVQPTMPHGCEAFGFD